MESLRKAFGISREHAEEREGDAFDQDLQAKIRDRKREDREEEMRAREERRVKDQRRREKDRKRAEKERKEAEKTRKKEEKRALKERARMEKAGIKWEPEPKRDDRTDDRGRGRRRSVSPDGRRGGGRPRTTEDLDAEMDGYMAVARKVQSRGGRSPSSKSRSRSV